MAALKLITAPVEEPLLLSEVKTWLRVDVTDFDVEINSLIVAARQYCESFLNRALVTQTWELTLDAFPDMPLKLPKPPLQSVNSVTYIDSTGASTVWASSNYIVDNSSEPGRIGFTYGNTWPSVTLQPINSFKVQFTCGYGNGAAVPENIKNAMRLYISHRFDNPSQQDIPKAVNSILWLDRVVPV